MVLGVLMTTGLGAVGFARFGVGPSVRLLCQHPSLREHNSQRCTAKTLVAKRGRSRLDGLFEDQASLVEPIVRSRELDGPAHVLRRRGRPRAE